MKKQIKGFTLVELMVIVGLIAILLAVILVNLNRSRIRARDNVRIADVQTIRLALEEYRSTCNVFPDTLEVTADNGRRGVCPGGVTLGDFISVIPTAPDRATASLLPTSTVPLNAQFNGYFYAGLSTTSGGPCYDYHIGVELEVAENNGGVASDHLSDDHDFEYREDPYDQSCGTPTDFGTTDAVDDDENGLYDFRSVNTR